MASASVEISLGEEYIVRIEARYVPAPEVTYYIDDLISVVSSREDSVEQIGILTEQLTEPGISLDGAKTKQNSTFLGIEI